MAVIKQFDKSSLKPEIINQLIKMDDQIMDFVWSHKQWLDWISNTQKFSIHCLFDNEQIIGFVVFELSDDTWAHLHKIGLNKEFRGLGLAGKLLEDGIIHLRSEGYQSCTLEVRELNNSAVKLYKRLGFSVSVNSRGYYSDGSNALKMICALH